MTSGGSRSRSGAARPATGTGTPATTRRRTSAASAGTSENVTRALELYELIHLHDQWTASRQAELQRLVTNFEAREAAQYYKRVRPLVEQLPMSVLLKRAAEETEWSYELPNA